ncbi:hypothetical protein [Marilutibacter chinensis]|uniref:PAS domain-containing protein n=1 Tax=Marilutibacter chinensis TaxID=2912247 RepID=A0ABS9HMZ8_9GAMM|nr:hypothetical protein [Lysobacter chinensis]MCF7220390.1 hypothetical protein [Lysobacter chinensis]
MNVVEMTAPKSSRLESWAIFERVMAQYEVYNSRTHLYSIEDMNSIMKLVDHSGQMAHRVLMDKHDEEVILAAFFYNIRGIITRSKLSVCLRNIACSKQGVLSGMGLSMRVSNMIDSKHEAGRYMELKKGCGRKRKPCGGDLWVYREKPGDVVMTRAEADRFESHTDFPVYLMLRELDDGVDGDGMPSGILSHVRRIAARHIR